MPTEVSYFYDASPITLLFTLCVFKLNLHHSFCNYI